MAVKVKGKEYLSYSEQIAKNKKDIEELRRKTKSLLYDISYTYDGDISRNFYYEGYDYIEVEVICFDAAEITMTFNEISFPTDKSLARISNQLNRDGGGVILHINEEDSSFYIQLLNVINPSGVLVKMWGMNISD